MINGSKNIFKNKYIIAAIAAAASIAILATFTVYGCVLVSGDNVIDGVSILNEDMSGKSAKEVKQFIDENLYVDDGIEIKFVCEDQQFAIPASRINLQVDTQKTANQIHNVGKNGNIMSRIIEGYGAKFSGREISPIYTCDENMLIASINEQLGDKVSNVTPYSVELKEEALVVTNSVGGKGIEQTNISDIIYKDLVDGKIDNIINLTITDIPKTDIDVEEFIKTHTHQAKNAEYSKEGNQYTFTPEVKGVSFDLDVARQIIEQNRNNTESYEIPVTVTVPEVTIEDLKNKFSANTLATYSTNFYTSDAGRSANIDLAASKINGYVLNPGQRFSFNKVVGPRTKAAGFKIAHVYEGDRVVDGIGGGICQVSSTLYNAVVRADLKIVYRTNHSMPVTYVPIGTDATVSYGAIDFIFENNKKTPVTIEATTHNKVLTITIKGTDESDGVKIDITTENIGYTPYPTTEVTDNSLKPGQTKVVKNGQNGSIYNAYKVYKKDGKVIKREFLTKSVYIPVSKVVNVGPKAESPKPAEPKPEEQPQPEPQEQPQPEIVPEPQPEQPQPDVPAITEPQPETEEPQSEILEEQTEIQ